MMLRMRSDVDAAFMRMKSMSAIARMMFAYDRRLTPLSIPASTDVSAAAVITARIAACTMPEIGTPKTYFIPELICSALRPVDTARPKTVATIEMMSIVRPIGPWMRSPRTGWNAEETRGGRLRL